VRCGFVLETRKSPRHDIPMSSLKTENRQVTHSLLSVDAGKRSAMHPSIHAKTNPEKPAYIMASTGETVNYKELDERSNQVAQLFRAHGLKPGDAIAIFMENNARYFEICWGAQRSGLYFTCISSRLTAGEIEYIAQDCGA